MRSYSRRLTFGALVATTALCGTASAQNGRISALLPILAPEAGNKACYSRAYDAAHLKSHPRQRITAMKFLLTVKAYDPKPANAAKPEDLYYYAFSMSVKRRGDKRLLSTSGDCNGDDKIVCAVDCDGGSVTLDTMPPANTLIVRLDTQTGITMYHDCDEEKDAVVVKGGADDKVFRLDRADAAVCKALDDDDK